MSSLVLLVDNASMAYVFYAISIGLILVHINNLFLYVWLIVNILLSDIIVL